MQLENGHPVEVIQLDRPPGRSGYVMHVSLGPGQSPLYVKLQLGAGIVIGRSFHYSDSAE